ncbi:hypothetical protein PISMIDRAFT_682076 [Pisolithus microcarpus 441]|uniref:Uncharacterized protein n=1 Tax=Pisolithus microcarpus 441 TaxID=765257 RepID=A0A0C9ZLC3_9AGAM|nr:hypothetical protein PISMIDRAFT_682076 [Pisolithus microcarpus 441]
MFGRLPSRANSGTKPWYPLLQPSPESRARNLASMGVNKGMGPEFAVFWTTDLRRNKEN